MEIQQPEVKEKSMPTIVKECADKRVIFRTNTYGKGLDLMNYMFEEAKKDFPELKIDEVQVVEFGGDRIKRVMGIEFDVQDVSTIPADYSRLAVIHPTI